MFDGFTAETLARMQFAFTVSFHIIFLAFSIGLANYLAVLNVLWLKTRDEPPVAIVFWSFRVMVGLGFAMLGLGAWSLWRRLRGRFMMTVYCIVHQF